MFCPIAPGLTASPHHLDIRFCLLINFVFHSLLGSGIKNITFQNDWPLCNIFDTCESLRPLMRGGAVKGERITWHSLRWAAGQSSLLKSQQPWEMEELEWLRVREGLLEDSGIGLYGIKEALGRVKRNS